MQKLAMGKKNKKEKVCIHIFEIIFSFFFFFQDVASYVFLPVHGCFKQPGLLCQIHLALLPLRVNESI